MERLAVICVDCPEEVSEFYGWLRRNRSHIIGISENRGCGCCVDIFNIVIDDVAEPMPGEVGVILNEIRSALAQIAINCWMNCFRRAA